MGNLYTLHSICRDPKIALKMKSIKNASGGPVVRNPPANAGDTGSIPGLGRSHMPQGNWVHVPWLPSPHSRAREPQLLSLCVTTTENCTPRACGPQQKKPPQRGAGHPRIEEACARQRRPSTANNKEELKNFKDMPFVWIFEVTSCGNSLIW